MFACFIVVGMGDCVFMYCIRFSLQVQIHSVVLTLVLTLSLCCISTTFFLYHYTYATLTYMYIYMLSLTHSDAQTHSTFGSGTGADDEQSRRITRVFSMRTQSCAYHPIVDGMCLFVWVCAHTDNPLATN